VIDNVRLFQPSSPPADNDALAVAVDDALAVLGSPAALTVLVNDPYRQTDTQSVLSLLRRRLPDAAIRALVAVGTHRVADADRTGHEAALRQAGRIDPIAWHDCRADSLVDIAAAGIWRGHPWLADSGDLLVIGSVEPHYFAGYTGAHKTATIGVAGFDDITANHAGAMDARCRPCRLDDNPVFDGVAAMLAALESTRSVAAVNLVQSGDRIIAATGGPPLLALRAAIPAALRAFAHRVDRQADALIAHVTGPLALNFYQADKGVKNSEHAVRDGGLIVLDAACPEGMGDRGGPGARRFVELLRQAPTCDQAIALVDRQGYQLGDHKAVRLRRLTDPSHRNVRLVVVSAGLSGDALASLGIGSAASVENALAQAGLDAPDKTIYRVQDAGNLCILPRRDGPDAAEV